MAITRPTMIALLCGPAGLLLAGRRLAAAGAAAALALALVAYAYVPYLQIYLELGGGGGSAHEVTQAAVRAAEVWLREAPRWAPGAWWVVGLANLACAAALAWPGGRAT